MKIKLPGDKSISHRALIFASLAQGTSLIKNLSPAEDVWSTLNVLKQLGTNIALNDGILSIEGKNLVYDAPKAPLNCGNAGTLMRLMMGVLCGQRFSSELIGDESLSRRPMQRVLTPLEKLGACIELTNAQTAPVKVHPSQIEGAEVEIAIASAQVKSAVMLAGVYARKKDLVLRGKLDTRDHTERMLKYFGAPIEVLSDRIILKPNAELVSRKIKVPNDISALSFWLVFALLAEKKLSFENILLTPSRMGFINVLRRSGVRFEIEVTDEVPEIVGNITVIPSSVKNFIVEPYEIPSLIDEIPVMCLLASQLDGESKIIGAQELRVKETDRILSTQSALENIGIKIHVIGDDIYIPGNQTIIGGVVDPKGDHRIAMMAGIATFFTKKEIVINDKKCADISDPYFFKNIDELTQG